MSVLYLGAAIVLEICGTTLLKLSQGFTRIGPAGAVVFCYTASFVLLSLALRVIDLSIAYALGPALALQSWQRSGSFCSASRPGRGSFCPWL